MSREPVTRSKIFRVLANLFVATVCGLTFGFTIQGVILSTAQDSLIGSRDFVVFWATGEQLAHHANPYDPDALLRIERAAGLSAQYSVMYMRNLPFALPLVYPLGFLSLRLASNLWSALLLLCLGSSVYMLWRMHGRPNNIRHWLGYSFGPALICLIEGQTTLFALLGLVVFLQWHRTRPFLAGISLWLCMLKPHLFLPFGVVLLLWIVVTRSYKILLGVTMALAASLWMTYLIDPLAWIQYRTMLHTSGIEWDFIPCMSILLRVWISKGTVWIQYVPGAVACVWALNYFWPRRRTWDWVKHEGSLLMLVSLLAAPYSWIYDGCIAIPALLNGAYTTRYRNVVVGLAFLSALIEVALFGNLFKPAAIHRWTMWSAPAWLIWYLVACTPSAKWTSAWSALKAMQWCRGRSGEEESSCDSGLLQEE